MAPTIKLLYPGGISVIRGTIYIWKPCFVRGSASVAWQATMVKGDLYSLAWPDPLIGPRAPSARGPRRSGHTRLRGTTYALLGLEGTASMTTMHAWPPTGTILAVDGQGDRSWGNVYANQDHRKPWRKMKYLSTRSFVLMISPCNLFHDHAPVHWRQQQLVVIPSIVVARPFVKISILSRLRVKILRPLNSRNYSHVICSRVL